MRRAKYILVNQICQSVLGLLINAGAVYILSGAGYGLYSVLISCSLLISGFLSAPISGPMMLSYCGRGVGAAYSGKILIYYMRAHAVLSVLMAPVFALLIYLYGVHSGLDFGVEQCVFVVFLGICVSARDVYIKKNTYTNREKYSAVSSLTGMTVGFLLMLALSREKARFGANDIILLYIACSLMVACLALLAGGGRIVSIKFSASLNNSIVVLKNGKWLIAGMVILWLQNQMYVYVGLYTEGVEGVGEINASRLSISPMLIILPALSGYMVPKLIRTSSDGVYLGKYMYCGAFLSVIVPIGYYFAISEVWGGVCEFYDCERYADYIKYSGLWCIYLSGAICREVFSGVALSRGKYLEITAFNAISMVFGVVCAILLQYLEFRGGVVVSAGMAEFVLAFILWMRLKKNV